MTEYPLMVRIDDGNDVTKCWLSSDELTRLGRTAGRDDWMLVGPFSYRAGAR